MRRKMIIGFVGILVLVAGLVGCQPAPSATQAPAATESEMIAETPAAAPAEPQSAQPGEQAYPAPVEMVPFNPYPTPVSGERIDWGEVPEVLQGGQVATVFQAFSLEVTLTMDDDRVLVTTAPARDVVFDLVRQCGEPCVDISMIAEG